MQRRGKKGFLLFKVDFIKANGKVGRKFLDYMLRRMCFGEVWRS